MSNLAEKLPQLIREALEDTETRKRQLAERVDAWVEQNIPQSIVEPLRGSEILNVERIRTAAEAAGDELLGLVKDRWQVLRGGRS